jgi:hypothetical protein
MNIFSVSSAMLKAIQQKEPVILKVKVITEINLGWTRIPYENTQELTLKK